MNIDYDRFRRNRKARSANREIIHKGKAGVKMEKYCTDSALPLFLRESINAFLEGKEKYESGVGYTEFDMDYCDLQTDINVCEVEQMITPEEAWQLRERYLGLQKL